MDAAELDYELPESAIAQSPVEPRDSARLLVAAHGGVQHRVVADLDSLLGPGDLLVVNDTRVIPARLHLHKATGGAVEVLLLEHRGDGEWEALVRPGRRVPPGTVLTIDADNTPADGHPSTVTVTVGPTLGADGRRSVRVELAGSDSRIGDLDGRWLNSVGEVPLPPYIHEPLRDPERYQTVFAHRPGSVAAPTAGLHLTEDLLDRCRSRGVTVARVELVVGLGTFRPITAKRVEDHPMHSEHYRIPEETLALLHDASRVNGPGRTVAVGTTVVRALESWAATGEAEGDTSLFIHGDYPFAVVDCLMTNFHVPRSSLLALVEAFAGPGWRQLYSLALAERYRFLSFGDAMLLDRGALGVGAA